MKEKYILITEEEEQEERQKRIEEKDKKELPIKQEIEKIYMDFTNAEIIYRNGMSDWILYSILIFWALVIFLGVLILPLALHWPFCWHNIVISIFFGPGISFLVFFFTYADRKAYIISCGKDKFIIEKIQYIGKKRQEIKYYPINGKYYNTYSTRKKVLCYQKIFSENQISFFYHYQLWGSEKNFEKTTTEESVIYCYGFSATELSDGEGIDLRRNYSCKINFQNNEIRYINSYRNFTVNKLAKPLILPQDLKIKLQKEGIKFPETDLVKYI